MINELLNRRRSKIRVNKLIDKNGKVHNTPTAIAENFNEYFAYIASNLKNEIANRNEFHIKNLPKLLTNPLMREFSLNILKKP